MLDSFLAQSLAQFLLIFLVLASVRFHSLVVSDPIAVAELCKYMVDACQIFIFRPSVHAKSGPDKRRNVVVFMLCLGLWLWRQLRSTGARVLREKRGKRNNKSTHSAYSDRHKFLTTLF